jgi:hypothetical protein
MVGRGARHRRLLLGLGVLAGDCVSDLLLLAALAHELIERT